MLMLLLLLLRKQNYNAVGIRSCVRFGKKRSSGLGLIVSMFDCCFCSPKLSDAELLYFAPNSSIGDNFEFTPPFVGLAPT